jgi:transcriptional regulator with XRE-family HTH domain
LNRLKQLRKEKNINQDVLAKILGIEVAGISKLETGRVPLKDEYIIKLSEYFNVSSDYLLGKSDIRKPETQNEDLLDLAKVGFTKDNYNPPSDKQKEQIRTILETILEDNKKDNKNDNNE